MGEIFSDSEPAESLGCQITNQETLCILSHADQDIKHEYMRMTPIGDNNNEIHRVQGEQHGLHGQDDSRGNNNITIVVHATAEEKGPKQIHDIKDPYRSGLRVMGMVQDIPCARVL